MTLVVARRLSDTIWIVSDTVVYNPKSTTQSELGLKVFMIDSNTLAAYSGSPPHAHALLKSLAQNASTKTPEDPAAVLANAQKEFIDSRGPAEIDFIVVHSGKISRISEGKNEQVEAAWLGDHNSFESFQHYCGDFQKGARTPLSDLFDPNGAPQSRADLTIINVDSVPGCSGDEISSGMIFHDALQLVISNLAHSSVGGQVTVATSSPRGTRYLSFSGASSPIFQPSFDGWETVDFGDAVRGGYAFTT